MKRAKWWMAAMGIVAIIALGLVNPNSALAADNYRTHLTGKAEVALEPVETLATGEAIFRLSAGGTELYYKLIVANITGVVQAHIHLAPAGVNGPGCRLAFRTYRTTSRSLQRRSGGGRDNGR